MCLDFLWMWSSFEVFFNIVFRKIKGVGVIYFIFCIMWGFREWVGKLGFLFIGVRGRGTCLGYIVREGGRF